MSRLVALGIIAAALSAPPALAVNDPVAPGDTCGSASGTAIGHPAFANEQAGPVSAPFSVNNPGVADTSAQGGAKNQAPCG